MNGCPAIAADADAGLAGGLSAVDCHVHAAVSTAYGRLLGENGVFGAALTAALTIYIAVLAYGLITGRTRATLSEMTPRVFAIGLVLTFTTAWPAYATAVYGLLTAGPDQIASAFAGAGRGATLAFGAKLDLVFADFVELIRAIAAQGKGSPNLQLATWLTWFSTMAFMLLTVGLLIAARIALGVLLALGPVFILMGLFQATRGLFEGWLRTAVAVAVIPLFIVLGGAGVMGVLAPMLTAILDDPVSAIAELRPIAAIFIVAVIYAILLLAMVWAALNLTHNWRLPPAWRAALESAGGRQDDAHGTQPQHINAADKPAASIHTDGARITSVMTAVLRESRPEIYAGVPQLSEGAIAAPAPPRSASRLLPGLGQAFRRPQTPPPPRRA